MIEIFTLFGLINLNLMNTIVDLEDFMFAKTLKFVTEEMKKAAKLCKALATWHI